MLKQFIADNSYGKYFVFDGKSSCFILGDEKYNDFVAVIRINHESKVVMYEGEKPVKVPQKRINDIIGRLNNKLYQSLLCSFSLTSEQIGELKQLSRSATHIELSVTNNEVVFGMFDYRDVIEDKVVVNTYLTGRTVNISFQKIILAETFNKMIKRQDYLVNISKSEYVEFESMKDSTKFIFQEQLTS